MTLEFAEAHFLDDGTTVTMTELVERSGLTPAELEGLVECGALAPAAGAARAWVFSLRCIVVARTARRLREELALDDSHSLAVVLRLTQRIDALEDELRSLRPRP